MPETREAYQARTNSLRLAIESLCEVLKNHGPALGLDSTRLKAIYRHLYSNRARLVTRMTPTDKYPYYRLLFRTDSTGKSLVNGNRRVGRNHVIGARVALIALGVCDKDSAPQIGDEDMWQSFFIWARDRVLAAARRADPPDAVASQPKVHTSCADLRNISGYPIEPAALDPSICARVPPYFVGRSDELAAVASAFASRRGPSTVVLQGIAGVGKSALAAAYCREHRGEFGIIGWLDATTENSFRADLAAFGLRLGCIRQIDNAEAAADKVMQILQASTTPLLLVLDNVSDAEAFERRRDFTGSAHLLVTSNWDVWAQVGACIEVKPWDVETAAQFVARRFDPSPESSTTLVLAKELGGLPFALEQAARYCARFGVPVGEFGRRILSRNESFFEEEVGSAFQQLVFAAREMSPDASTLLNCIALLPSDPISTLIFTEGQDHEKKPLFPDLVGKRFDFAIQVLRRFGLVSRQASMVSTNGSFWVDQITTSYATRYFAASQISAAERRKTIGTLYRSLYQVYSVSPSARQTADDLLNPHVLAVCEEELKYQLPERSSFILLNIFGLMNAVAIRHEIRAQYSVAHDIFNRTLALQESSLGAQEHKKIATISCLASLLVNCGHIAKARPWCERAWAIQRTLPPNDSYSPGFILSIRAALLREEGEFVAARQAYEEALTVREAHNDIYHALPILLALADLFVLDGDLATASKHCDRALDIAARSQQSDNPHVALVTAILGRISAAKGELVGARDILTRALAMCERLNGRDHPQNAPILASLADVSESKTDLDEPWALRIRAFAVCAIAYGLESSKTAAKLIELAQLVEKTGAKASASALYSQAFAGASAALGRDCAVKIYPKLAFAGHSSEASARLS